MTKVQLNRLMVETKGAYPALFTESPDEWQNRVDRYFAKLRRFDLETVRRAFDRAEDGSPTRYPAAPAVANMARKIEAEDKASAEAQNKKAAEIREDRLNAENVAYRRAHVIPHNPEDQQAWIDAANDDFERLARQWEVESKIGGWDPNRPSPKGVGERRAAELVYLAGSSGFVKSMPQPNNGKPEPGWDG